MIVSSVIDLDNPQIDGRRIMMEIHTDDHGNRYPISYMAEATTDINEKLIEHADQLNQQLQNQRSGG